MSGGDRFVDLAAAYPSSDLSESLALRWFYVSLIDGNYPDENDLGSSYLQVRLVQPMLTGSFGLARFNFTLFLALTNVPALGHE
jgi:hypothetical protein